MTLRRVAPYLVPYFPQMPTFLVWLPYNNTNHSESLFTDITHTLRGEESSAQEGDLTIVMKRSNKLKTIKYLSTTSSLIHSLTLSITSATQQFAHSRPSTRPPQKSYSETTASNHSYRTFPVCCALCLTFTANAPPHTLPLRKYLQ